MGNMGRFPIKKFGCLPFTGGNRLVYGLCSMILRRSRSLDSENSVLSTITIKDDVLRTGFSLSHRRQQSVASRHGKLVDFKAHKYAEHTQKRNS